MDANDKTDETEDNAKDTQTAVVRMEGIVSTSKEAKSCPICLTSVSNRSLTDTCLHEFCFECLEQWSANHNHCPVCRQAYQHIVHNIVSEEVFARTPVHQHDEEVDSEITAVLRQMFLFLRVISARNRSIRLRERVSDSLDELDARLDGLNDNEDDESREESQQLEQQIQELWESLDRIDTDINELNEILNSDDPTEVDLQNSLNGREEDFEDVIGVIDVIIPDNPDPDDNNDNEDDDDRSVDDEMPPLESTSSNSGSRDSDSGDVSTDESEDESDRRHTIIASARRRHSDSSSSDDSDYCPPKQKRRKH